MDEPSHQIMMREKTDKCAKLLSAIFSVDGITEFIPRRHSGQLFFRGFFRLRPGLARLFHERD
jgi:hypothetical protein